MEKILICVFLLVVIPTCYNLLMYTYREHFTMPVANMSAGDYISQFTTNIGNILKNINFGYTISGRLPDKKPCKSGERDDGTSCWIDTYANGVGTVPILNDCPSGSKDVAGTCWLDSSCQTSGGECTTVDNGYWNLSWGAVGCNGPQQQPTYITVPTVSCTSPGWNGCCTHAPWWLGGGCIGCPTLPVCTAGTTQQVSGWNDCYNTWISCSFEAV